jgi:hypothetical protein
MSNIEKSIEFLSCVVSAAAAAFLLYVLSAPPAVMAQVRQSGNGAFPAFYRPIERILCSDYGGAVLWYFNSVWGADVVLLGPSDPVWYVVAICGITAIAFGSLIACPFWLVRRRKRR